MTTPRTLFLPGLPFTLTRQAIVLLVDARLSDGLRTAGRQRSGP